MEEELIFVTSYSLEMVDGTEKGGCPVQCSLSACYDLALKSFTSCMHEVEF